MKVFAKVKQAGKRRDILGKKEYLLETKPETLGALITMLVEINVKEYNEGKENLVTYMTDKEIAQRGAVGKVAFGDPFNTEKQKLYPAIENALLSFSDGLYYVFINDRQIKELNEKIEIRDGDLIQIVKLIMLAGRLW